MSLFAAVVLLGTAALAPLSCVEPNTAIRSALCSDPVLRAADNSLTASYNALLARTHAASREALAAMHERFLRNREACLSKGDARETCLITETDKQRLRLSGAPLSGTGLNSPVISVFTGRLATERAAALEVLLPRFAEPARPGERAANAAIDRFWRDTPFRRGRDPYRTLDAIFGASGEVSYASAGFISVRVTVIEPGEQANTVARVVGINQILDVRRRTAFGDVFTAEAVTRIAADCEPQIVVQRREFFAGLPIGTEGDPQAPLETIIGDLANWSFDEDGATIYIAQGLLGAPAEGPYRCRLTTVQLRPVVTPGVDLWR